MGIFKAFRSNSTAGVKKCFEAGMGEKTTLQS